MILINEFFPNPAGSDADGEWIELFNSGSATQDITGWALTAGAKGKFVFPKTVVQGGEFLVVHRKNSKLTLRNTDEAVSLYDGDGNQVDFSSFVGTAPEGKSWNRIGLDVNTQNYIFATPTPGEVNRNFGAASLIENMYPANAPLNAIMSGGEMIFLAFAAAVVVSSLVLYVAIKNEYLNDIFFSKY
ncbi:MAG: lamin tail domain-containing protein [Patescibacteria group bacterium]